MIADDNNMFWKFRRAMSVIYIVYICARCHRMQGAPSSFKWKPLLHNSIMCKNLDFLNLQALIPCWYLQTIYLGWGIQLSLQTPTTTLSFCQNIEQVFICDWLITWPSTCTQSSQIEYPAMDQDVQAVQSGVKTQWTKYRTCISFFFWAAQFLHSWPMFLGTALLF